MYWENPVSNMVNPVEPTTTAFPNTEPNARSFSLTQVAAPTHHLSGFDQMATERMAIGRRSGDLPKSRI